MDDRIKIAIMTATDQFNVAFAVLGLLEENKIEISNEITDEIVDCVLAMTEEFSVGFKYLEDDPD